MTRYRKKPLIVEAMQVDFMDIDWQAIYKFIGAGRSITTECYPRADNPEMTIIDMYITTDIECSPVFTSGDWIIKDPDGTLYPCPQSLFAINYEQVAA